MRVSWALIALAACYAPQPPAGAPCSETQQCPVPLICDRGLCVTTPAVFDATIDVVDADTTCVCTSATNLTCAGGDSTCVLGCFQEQGSNISRCHEMIVSNNVGVDDVDDVTSAITITGGTATFNTQTGAITGAMTRPAGIGVLNGIAFRTAGALGVFTFHALEIAPSGIIRFVGTRAVAFVVGTSATIDGVIDGAGGCDGISSCAGPGGGTGGFTTPALGCGPGGGSMTDDCGGGGGGGGTAGANGGAGAGPGGIGGPACIATTAEPLVGGSGGGAGDAGMAAPGAPGGGGGGGFQLSALEVITLRGTIDMGGGGGGGGPVAAGSSSAGSGGGAGGAILLEAPDVTLTPSAHLAANGGGGGGGGDTQTQIAGMNGARGGTSTTPASGGMAGGGSATAGGAGAAGTIGAQAGGDTPVTGNAGGGGGGVGVIYLRAASTPTTSGAIVTPPPGVGPVRTD
ncbi:MAG: hypothetical protein ACKV2T_30770 [Kofleriaceae bacterium]